MNAEPISGRTAQVLHAVIDTPVGPMHLYVDPTPTANQPQGALVGVLFDSEPGRTAMRHTFDEAGALVNLDHHQVLLECAAQLGTYFAGSSRSFNLPLRASGTAFQHDAWAGLCTIPYGETLSYGQQAALIGKPTAVRAIGAANGRNPISIIVPCHRVIGANGGLTGFGGGIATKAWLLCHESGLPHSNAQLTLKIDN